MKHVALFLVAMLLVGCGAPSRNKWVLMEYSIKDGYTFSRNGRTYLAECYNSVAPNGNVQAARQNWERLTNGQGPPEDECTAILVYLHKPTPVQLEDDQDTLTFQDDRGVTYQFKVVRIK